MTEQQPRFWERGWKRDSIILALLLVVYPASAGAFAYWWVS